MYSIHEMRIEKGKKIKSKLILRIDPIIANADCSKLIADEFSFAKCSNSQQRRNRLRWKSFEFIRNSAFRL